MRKKIWNLLPLLPLQESVILLRGWLHGCPSPTVREYCICKHSLSSESGTVIALPVRRRQVTEPNYSPKVISPSLLSNTNLRLGHLSARRSRTEGSKKKKKVLANNNLIYSQMRWKDVEDFDYESLMASSVNPCFKPDKELLLTNINMNEQWRMHCRVRQFSDGTTSPGYWQLHLGTKT